jgi:hypothetical protein
MGTYQIRENRVEVIELPVSPCIDCGGTEVKPFDCGYSAFNVCGAKCCRCGRTIKRMGDYSVRECIELWNSRNGEMTDSERLNILRDQLKAMNQTPEV